MKITSCGLGTQFHAFCLTDAGAILHSARLDNQNWTDWVRIHPDVFADVSCASVANAIHVIAITQIGITVHSILDAQGHWQGFLQLPFQPLMAE
jgi:hypothetical protein